MTRGLLNCYRCLRGIYLHQSSEYNLKMDETHSSETLVMMYQSTWHHISEESNLHSHCHENIIYQIIICCNITIWKDVFLSGKPCRNGITIWSFREHVCVSPEMSDMLHITFTHTEYAHSCPNMDLRSRTSWPSHPAVCTGTANRVLCGYNRTFSYVIITSIPDDEDRDSLWKVRSQPYLQTADCLWRFHCIYLFWKLQITHNHNI